MNSIVDEIKQELLNVVEEYKKNNGYDFWNDHIKYVVKNAVMLAKKYNADAIINLTIHPIFHPMKDKIVDDAIG